MSPHFIPLTRKAKDITGQRFGHLVALGPISKQPPHRIMWLCRCDCGNDATVRPDGLKNGAVVSCGCVRLSSVTKHGMSTSQSYRRWRNIIDRCDSPKNIGYERYGGRGIAICDEWRDFETFHDYVNKLSDYSKKGYTLDRIDNDGNYEPGNVRWATAKQQQRNRRGNRMITANGSTRTLHEWAEVSGLAVSTIFNRLKGGWTPEDAVTLSPDKRRNRTG